MVSSDARTVEDYLGELDEDRRELLRAVRDRLLDVLPDGYEEVMRWGMITYEVPLTIQPDTYNGQPLMYAALASQKRHCSLYLCGIYQDELQMDRLRAAYETAGRKADMGKSCVRFRQLEELPLDTICELVGATTPQAFARAAQACRKRR